MYQAIYYWVYYYLSKVKTNKTTAFNAFLLIVLLEGANCISIGRFIYNATHFNSDDQTATVYGTIVVLSLMGFNFFYLYQRRDTIFKQVSEYSESQLKSSNGIFWIYVIASILFIVVVVMNS